MNQPQLTYQDAIAQLTGAGGPFEIAFEGGLRRYCNAPATLPQALESGRQFGEQEFLVYEGERWHFADMALEADAVACALQQRDVGKGDRVVIAMRNYPEWMAAFAGIVSIGAVAVPLNSWGTPRELGFAVQDAGPALVFCDQARFEGIGEMLADAGIEAVIARPADPDNAMGWESCVRPHRGHQPQPVAIQGNDPAMVMYTSGTSGRPKGALSSHDAICQALVNLDCTGTAAAMCNAEQIGRMMQRGHPPTALLAVPLFHVSGCHAQFLSCFRGGRRIVMMYKWDPAVALRLIESEHVTTLAAAPAMLLDLLESPDFEQTDTSSLFALAVGGAATPPLLLKRLSHQLPEHFYGTGWGMTETNAQGTSLAGAQYHLKPGSAGLPHPIVDLRICDDTGAEQPQGTPGDIWIRSVANIRNYWQRPDANASEFRDGWLKTGDVGHLDEDNYLYLGDRAKDMIIRGGENIYPVEIENCLLESDVVKEAAVIGLPDERLGEKVTAVVCLHPGSTITESSLQDFLRERLAAFKVPSSIIFRNDPIPRNATDKMLKQHLRQELMQR